jgi:tetratricopeptide (TPR) repeat protein
MAIQLRPDFAEAYNNRGNVHFAAGNLDPAIDDYTQAIACNPGYAEAYNNRGNAYGRKGDLAGAIRDHSAAIRINPGYTVAYSGRAIDYFSQRRYAEAWADIRRLRQLGGSPDPALIKDLSAATGMSE